MCCSNTPPKAANQARRGTIARNAAEIHRNDFVHRLGLPVCLGMERRAEAELDAGELEEVAPNMTSEHEVPITDDGGRSGTHGDEQWHQ